MVDVAHYHHSSVSQTLMPAVILHLFQWNSPSAADFRIAAIFQLFVFTIFLLTSRQPAHCQNAANQHHHQFSEWIHWSRGHWLYCIDLFSCIAASLFNKLTYSRGQIFETKAECSMPIQYLWCWGQNFSLKAITSFQLLCIKICTHTKTDKDFLCFLQKSSGHGL